MSRPALSSLAGLALAACGPAAPEGMVHIAEPALGGAPGFWIDRYEFPGRQGERPELRLSLQAARERCASQGKRLCTAAEWRRACLGPTGDNDFGYGPTWQAGRCVDSHALSSGHTSIVGGDDGALPAGAMPGCATPEGVHDLVGNAEEWVLDDWRGVDGMLEGGAWYTWTGYPACRGIYSREPDFRVVDWQPIGSATARCCWSEQAPTEAALTPAAIGADRERRLDQARAASSQAPYDPTAEVEVAPGLWMDVYEYPNRRGEVPRTAVSALEAQALCAAAGRRLCTAGEWERACAGTDGRTWPYGPTFVDGACNVGQATPPRAGDAWGCLSPAGVLDLAGSVWEWTATPLDAPSLGSTAAERLHEIRGGSWLADRAKGVCQPTDGYPFAPADQPFPDLGFRCCRGQAQVAPAPSPAADLPCPEGMVALAGPAGPYCIDRFEFPGLAGATPAGGLDLSTARARCQGVGKHVCTEAEWMTACAGPGGRRWPYGDLLEAGRCSDASDHAASPDRIGGEPLPAGSKAGCASPEGVHDLSGNLWEWTEGADGAASLRGGGWELSAGLGQCRAIARAEAQRGAAEFGVRCCASPDEARALRGAP
ncbi:formylglycine-generating enzyme family protein [Myxococcota bacterium]|nr:formylglycine-generating enzyme family protein [Myxococcota bacterium]